MDYQKDQKRTEGKTKIIWEIKNDSRNVIIENKNDITAFDDPKFTKQFKTKAIYATTVTCRVFELLKNAGIPVAFVEQISATEFVSPICDMIPLEVVCRRFAVGSFLKRHPELINEDKDPHRFHNLVVEFFLKTTEGALTIDGKKIIDGLDPQKGEEDPFIENFYEDNWNLCHPKKPSWEEGSKLDGQIEASKVLKKNSKEMAKEIEEIMRKVFLVLEGAWNNLGYRIIDMKIEFGIDNNGKLIVADVIDNDSWRLRDADWNELSKEAFRQGEELDEVEKKYGFVASLSKNFRIPKQALLMWRGSESDSFPDLALFKDAQGVTIEKVTMSGHKSTQMCLKKLEEILGKYPDGGVIIAKVGRSNGLGPIVAARTSWPVIAVPATMDSFPEDVWSSVRMPSKVPLATVWPESNAVLLASEILAQKNPSLYQRRQIMIEAQDE
ncbi:AIR carboxylase family protein [Candidatus Parcubacteria bacterium]|nr:AIR carboxylase family protein [Candidatus Parcubacteria bacterium]